LVNNKETSYKKYYEKLLRNGSEILPIIIATQYTLKFLRDKMLSNQCKVK
jgi:hypothetical protein